MHELSICQQIVKQASAIAVQNQALGIASISLKIGPLSGVEGALLMNAFPFVAAKTLAENAKLVIEPQPVVIQCKQCGSKTTTTPSNLVCKWCGDFGAKLLRGDEMLLSSVELISANHLVEKKSV